LRAGETHKLTEKDNHRRKALRVKPGDKVQVLLRNQPGTGYSWKLAADSTKLLEQDKDKPKVGDKVDEKGEPLKDGRGPGRPGGFEYRLYHFQVPAEPVAKDGPRELKFNLARFRGDDVEDTFVVPIEVIGRG
jgi:hypothetical protein